MSTTEWTPVVRFALKGSRFEGSLSISDLPELEAFQQLVRDTAAAIWRRRHPDRIRLPKGFDLATQLRFTHIEAGSSVIPLEAQAVFPTQVLLFDEQEGGEIFRAVTAAIELTWAGITAGNRGERLPQELPREVIPRLGSLGSTLGSDERVEVTPIPVQGGGTFEPAVLDAATRMVIEAQVPGRYEDHLIAEGHITAADVTYRRFRLHTADGRDLAADFTDAQEQVVTTALRDHDSITVAIEGRALFDSDGRPLRIVRADNLRMLPDSAGPEDRKQLWAALAAFGKASAVAGLPTDLATNLDAHLYDEDK